MSGKCYSCWCTFGLFNKELGCRNCGYSFCKKCLTKKVVIHKTSGEECLVCNKCYAVLTGINQSTKSSADFEPPQVLAKRIAEAKIAAQNKEKRQKEKKEIKNKDDELMARLANIKENCDSKKVPSEEELEQRLKNIKEFRGDFKNESSTVIKNDEVDNLLDEILNEVYLDSNFSLGDKTSAGNGEQDLTNVDNLIKKVTQEVALEERTSKEQNEKDKEILDRLENLKKKVTQERNEETNSSSIIKELRKKWEQEECESTSEEKWCCICNEDTEFQCLECDGDLYCPRCFKKGHTNFVEKHNLVPINKT